MEQEQFLGDATPTVYQIINTQEHGGGPTLLQELPNAQIIHQPHPNLQALNPVPPEQLREEGYVTAGNQARAPEEGDGEEEEERGTEEREESGEERRGEKEKKSAKRAKERRKWEERSRQLEAQLQQQKWQAQQDRARQKAARQKGKRAGREDSDEEAPEAPYFVKEKRHGPPAEAPSFYAPQQADPRTAWSMPQPPQWPGVPQQPPHVVQQNPSHWQSYPGWQHAPPTGGWVWKHADATEAPKGKRKTKQVVSEDSDSSDEEDRERERKKKDKEKNWEKETQKQRSTRYKKYEKMSETADNDKQSVKHQVAAMYKSVIAQEKTIKHLKSLYYKGCTEEQIQENKDLLEEVVAARKDLVDRITYLEVAFDYDWEAAKVFLEMREANPSSIVLKAVTEAKKRKAAVKGGKEGEEKKRKKPDANNNSAPSGSSSWRNPGYQYPAYNAGQHNLHWMAGQNTQAAPPFYGYPNPYPPAAPYNRQAGSFRPPRPPGCFNCGEANHGFRRCPNAPASTSAPKPPPPPPT